MTRYIDADALKKAMDRYWGTCQRIRKPRNGETAVFLDVRATVEKQPTIDAEPVRHGKWIVEWKTEDTRMLRCSKCRMVFNVGKGRDGNYCPECGAKMDGNLPKYDTNEQIEHG